MDTLNQRFGARPRAHTLLCSQRAGPEAALGTHVWGRTRHGGNPNRSGSLGSRPHVQEEPRRGTRTGPAEPGRLWGLPPQAERRLELQGQVQGPREDKVTWRQRRKKRTFQEDSGLPSEGHEAPLGLPSVLMHSRSAWPVPAPSSEGCCDPLPPRREPHDPPGWDSLAGGQLAGTKGFSVLRAVRT